MTSHRMLRFSFVGLALAGACAGPEEVDAGLPDAAISDTSVRDDTADASPLDALGTDAFAVDASEAMNDATTALESDAYVLPDAMEPTDAYVIPDAHVPPDAYTLPDAYTPPDAHACNPETQCDGLDEDCDGRIDEALTPPACDLTAGICAFASPRTCMGASGWSTCSYGGAYQASETTCDGFDNDCDGTRDEGCACTGSGACGAQSEVRYDVGGLSVNPFAMEALAGGGFVIAGETAGPANAFLTAVGLDGSPRWTRTYTFSRTSHLRDVEPLPDGGMVAVGWLDDNAPTFDEMLVMRLNSSGDVLWVFTFDGGASERGNAVEWDGDGIIVGAESGGEGLLATLNLDGSLREAQRLNATDAFLERVADVVIGPSGAVLFGEAVGSRADAFVYDMAARRGVRIASHRVVARRIRNTRSGFVLSGMVQSYEGDTGSALAVGLTPALGISFYSTTNETYSEYFDTVELAGGTSISGGSNAWAMIETRAASGSMLTRFAYRPLAPSGRNDFRALVALADGGFASVAHDGSNRLWFFRGNAAGQATGCTRDNGWWTNTASMRMTTPYAPVRTATGLTSRIPSVTATSVVTTSTAVCPSVPY